jgi:hypothetical protein
MAEGEATVSDDVDPNESPFPVPAIEGLPFARDSAEARAIRLILDEPEREPVRDRQQIAERRGRARE